MKRFLLALSLILAVGATQAQWSITTLGATGDTITFDATFSGVNNGTFAGSGFVGTPAAGQLDSDAWKFTGFSNGDTYFGGSFTTGDYAQGPHAGGTFSGGLYAFEVATGDTAMGIQPTGSDWTPGSAILMVINNTGSNVDSVFVAYDVIVNNDADRANTFDFSYSINDSTSFNAVTSMAYTSVDSSQGSVAWIATAMSGALNLSMADGDTLYLRWDGDDSSGGGSRDEFALDNIVVSMSVDTSTSTATIPYYSIPTITTVDSNGVADSMGVTCMTSGVVMGIDMDGNAGLSFTLWNQGGINIFNFVDVDNYVVTEGDSIVVVGEVDQFNGLTQLFVDSISLISTGNSIPTPMNVTSLGENTESELVRIDNFWVDGFSGSNYFLTDGTNNVTMRIDSDTDIPGNVDFAIGDTICYIIGIGGQFDFSSPYDEGYQVFPHRASDVDNSCGSIIPPPTPYYPIPDINNVDANGEPDSIGVYCWTSGVVLGVDLDGNAGLSFTLWDEEGINVFNFVDVSNYVVTEGDSLRLRGNIAFYNGLTEIMPDSIIVLNSGNDIPSHMTVSAPSEETESMPIRLVNVTVIDTSQWPTSFSSNVDLLTCAGDTVVMRIDSDTDVDENWPSAPTGAFTVYGIGGQFDNNGSDGYFSGYQIFPMTYEDIDTSAMSVPSLVINEIMSANDSIVADEAGDFDMWFELKNTDTTNAAALAGIFITDDANDAWKFMVDGASTASIAASDYELVWADNEPTEGDLHTNFQLNTAGGFLMLTSADGCTIIDSISYPALSAGQSYGYYPEGTDTLVTFESYQTTPGMMNSLLGNGVGEFDSQRQLVVYPNPAGSSDVVRFNEQINFTLYTITGVAIKRAVNAIELSVSGLASGTYLVVTDRGEVLRMVIQ